MMTKMLFLERRPHPESISVGGSGHFVVRRSTNLYLLNTNSAIAHKPVLSVLFDIFFTLVLCTGCRCGPCKDGTMQL